ncbi:MAG: hypothetical protein ACI82F_001784 [Planctomycetota bacterium]|jgi:hypothetical protein
MSFASCVGSGVADEQLLELRPREYEVSAAAELVWPILREQTVERQGHRQLAESPNDYMISWLEDAETWRGLDRQPDDAPDDGLYGQMLQHLGDDAKAVTSVWLSGSDRGCRIRVRRTYYSSVTQPYVASSRGHYTYNLVYRICSALGLPKPPSQPGG